MERRFVKVEKGLGPQGRIAVVRFDRGDNINALSQEAMRELRDVPRDGDTLSGSGAFTLLWAPTDRARPVFYRVDLETDDGAALLSALLPRSARRYEAPSWVAERAKGRSIRWRVTGLTAEGAHTASSAWRSLRIPATLPTSRNSGESPRTRP
jgi:hypothetical protein